jgi:phosphoribosylaminoimidazole carboxylase PurK protein
VFPTNLGIIGGGQLARMLALKAYSLGLRPILFVKDLTNDCAVNVVGRRDTFLDSGDLRSFQKFAKSCDLIIIENEFLDLNLVKKGAGNTPVYPNVKCLGVVQNKLDQKCRMLELGIPTLKFKDISEFRKRNSNVNANSNDTSSENGIDDGSEKLLVKELNKRGALGATKVVLKKARFGYDGNGVFVLNTKLSISKKNAVSKGFSNFIDIFPELEKSGWPFDGYLEEYADFKKELAVIVSRDIFGNVSTFPVIETCQRNGMCVSTEIPLGKPRALPKSIEGKALKLAKKVIKGFDGVGVFGVEMFWLKDGRVVVNEIAPRVHNSGHITMNGFNVCQFEQHLRAVTGMGLITPHINPKIKSMAMVNIVGEIKQKQMRKQNNPIFQELKTIQSEVHKGDSFWIYWYDKKGKTFGRKLGHINVTSTLGNGRALKAAYEFRKNLKI